MCLCCPYVLFFRLESIFSVKSNQIKSRSNFFGSTLNSSQSRSTLRNHEKPVETKQVRRDLVDVRSSSPATGKGGGNSLPVTLSQPQSPAIRIGMNKKHLFCPFFFAIFTVFVNFSARRFYMFFFRLRGRRCHLFFISLFLLCLATGFAAGPKISRLGKILFYFLSLGADVQLKNLTYSNSFCAGNVAEGKGHAEQSCFCPLLFAVD